MAFLRTVFGLPLGAKHQIIYRDCTKRTTVPTKPFNEVWLCIGRRGGKSRVLALIATYLACFFDWRPYLSPGERAAVICVATDRKQARIIFRYIEAFLREVPLLKKRITRSTTEIFELQGQVSIEVHTASYRSVRGYTVVAALMDEIAFFRSEDTSNPDHEILDALRPGMATIPGAMLLCASSPYARKGELYKNYKKYFGKEDDNILVWQAPTWVMNPAIPSSFIDNQFERDATSAKAEFGAQFRTDIESYIPEEVVDDNVIPGRTALSFIPGYTYTAFCDPSGGSQDSMTLAIAHSEPGRVVLDYLKEVKPPFSPDAVVKEFSKIIKSYGLSQVYGDRYGGEWPRERFRVYEVNYVVATKTRSDLYRDMLPLLNAREVDLLDNKVLYQQLLNLERRTSKAGKDIIDHPPGSHDDLVNAAAGALCYTENRTDAILW